MLLAWFTHWRWSLYFISEMCQGAYILEFYFRAKSVDASRTSMKRVEQAVGITVVLMRN